MKKTLWMLGVAVAALTSCTQSEVLDVPESKMIGFETHVDKATRATPDVTSGISATLNAFYVYGTFGTSDNANGFMIDENELNGGEYYLNGYKSYSTDGAITWTNVHPKSWLANKTFRFAAYADGIGVATEADDVAKYNGVSFIHKTTVQTDGESASTNSDINDFLTDAEVSTSASNFENLWGLKFTGYSASTATKDLVAAIPLEKEVRDLVSSPGHINLTFKHLLAKVRFEFIHNDNSGKYLAIEPFSFTVKDEANCLVIYGETELNGNKVQDPIVRWTTPAVDRNLSLFPRDGENNDQKWNNGSKVEEFYVVPQSNNITLEDPIRIHSLDENGNITRTYQISSLNLSAGVQIKWMPGVMYRYYAEVVPGGNEIKFTASVTDWNDISSADKEMETTVQ